VRPDGPQRIILKHEWRPTTEKKKGLRGVTWLRGEWKLGERVAAGVTGKTHVDEASWRCVCDIVRKIPDFENGTLRQKRNCFGIS